MKYWLFVGRFQPFHFGHETLIRTKLDKGEAVCIACRNTGKNKKNPYTYEERKEVIETAFKKEFKKGLVKVIEIPDIKGIAWGRGVGYETEEIKLDDVIEKISATKIRNKQKCKKR